MHQTSPLFSSLGAFHATKLNQKQNSLMTSVTPSLSTNVALKAVTVLANLCAGLTEGFFPIVVTHQATPSEETANMLESIFDIFVSIMDALEAVLSGLPLQEEKNNVATAAGDILMQLHKSFIAPLFAYSNTKLMHLYLGQKLNGATMEKFYCSASVIAVYCLKSKKYVFLLHATV